MPRSPSELVSAVLALTEQLKRYNDRYEPTAPRIRGEADIFRADYSGTEEEREAKEALRSLTPANSVGRSSVRPERGGKKAPRS